MIAVNGDIIAQGSPILLNDVRSLTATIDIEDVRRSSDKSSRNMQATMTEMAIIALKLGSPLAWKVREVQDVFEEG